MIYNQKVKINDTTYQHVVSSFHNYKFVEFLIILQPVKIIEWNGIYNQDRAHFKFWFLGWKDFKVIHEKYHKPTDQYFSFIDKGEILPFGLKLWEHKHSVVYEKDNIYIIDNIKMEHNYFWGRLLFPILITPIIIRKFLYKLYFRYNPC